MLRSLLIEQSKEPEPCSVLASFLDCFDLPHHSTERFFVYRRDLSARCP